jgi:GNAT superfamily N-acetyltransferase
MTVTIADCYRPGMIGAITALHARYYGAHWGFGLHFEAKVASELAAFLSRYDNRTDRLWLALDGEEIVGSLILDGGEPEAARTGAHIRMFFLAEAYQGQGIGRSLMNRAIDFCDGFPYGRSYLTTFEGLDPARRLYESVGFRLVKEQRDRTWGVEVNEQLFERLRPRE